LINQSFENWTCEVHNDCPGNMFPDEYFSALNDTRFTVKNHERNLGGTASFNLAFNYCETDYVSILEDDNWWEPGFLKEMIAIMDSDPAMNIAWCNMRVWKEKASNKWEDTGKTIWPSTEDGRLFNWPHYKQAMGALHSNGAMLYRGKLADRYIIPDSCDFSIIEGVRERAFEYPIFLSGKPLANFSQTLQTNRSNDPLSWTCSQLLLLGSFIEGANDKTTTFKETLAFYRGQRPSPLANFFLAALLILKQPRYLTFFNLTDWLVFGRWVIKNAFNLQQLKSRLASKQDVYRFLLEKTISQNKHLK
jgi:glycosyltransferase involved in cell wall biosynthesis